jgi:hypothetical protein
MRKFLAICFIALLALPLAAQQRTGNIFIKAQDTDSNPLPGVVVTLTGTLTAPMTQITNVDGIARFLSLAVARDYMIKAELEGFKTEILENIIVVIGGNANITVTMEMGALEEEVTVTAVTPVVDSKKTAVGTNVTQEVLQSIPTARDPWVILQMAPSVMMDRENVGGGESGQQSNFVSRGASSYSNNVWAMDGIVITDPAAIGGSPSYYDFDAFEEMNITVGGADVTVQTGGVALNMVTRRGGNRVSLGGRFYMVDDRFQPNTDEAVAEIRAQEADWPGQSFAGVNRIRNNKDYGFNLGLPLVKDKAWFWGSFGVQDLKTQNAYGTPDDTLLTNFAAKINLQIIPENRFEAFIHSGKKEKWGRSASASFPGGWNQTGAYHFGSPVLKFQDEHMFGDNLFLSVKYAWSNAGFRLTPQMDEDRQNIATYNRTDSFWYNSYRQYYVDRPVQTYNGQANLFLDNVLGMSHDWKVGFDYAVRSELGGWHWVGNAMRYTDLRSPYYDWDGDGSYDLIRDMEYLYTFRGGFHDYGVNAWGVFVSDTATMGRFNFMIGARYDYQRPVVNPIEATCINPEDPGWQQLASTEVLTAMGALLPSIDKPQVQAVDMNGDAWGYKVLSPRLGVTYDLMGDGKTILKLALARYGDYMGTGSAGDFNPGGSGGYIYYAWMDSPAYGGNGDGMINFTELYWTQRPTGKAIPIFDASGNFIASYDDTPGWDWGSFDPDDPLALSDPYRQYDPKVNSSHTWEAMFTLEKELMTDLAVQANLTYRRYNNYNWNLTYFPASEGYTGALADAVQNQSWYVNYGSIPTLPGFDPKEAAGHDIWYMAEPYTDYTPYSWRQKRPDRYNDYMGVDLIMTKRLSNRWMVNASLTWQKQTQHFGDKGYLNPTNLWVDEGAPYSAYMGSSSGILDQNTYSRWLVKVSGLYQLPWGINLGGSFMAREGWVISESFDFTDYTAPNPASRSWGLVMSPFGTHRLPTHWNVTLRLEKMLNIGDFGKVYIMADLFNVFNNLIEQRRYQMDYGTYYYYGAGDARNYLSEYANFYRLDSVLNPRVVRLGVRFTF